MKHDCGYKIIYAFLQVFIPDYNVSVAELVIPGSDLSQHIRSDNVYIIIKVHVPGGKIDGIQGRGFCISAWHTLLLTEACLLEFCYL